jgi:hypothetical protein
LSGQHAHTKAAGTRPFDTSKTLLSIEHPLVHVKCHVDLVLVEPSQADDLIESLEAALMKNFSPGHFDVLKL